MSLIAEKVKNFFKQWFMPLISGIILISMGILAFYLEQVTFLTLANFFSFTFMLAGFPEIAFALANRQEMKYWSNMLIMGIVNIIFGLIFVANPNVSKISLMIIVGIAIIIRSIGGIILSFKLKKINYSRWIYLLILSILGIMFVSFLMLRPSMASHLLTILIGIALIFGGIVCIVQSMVIKHLDFLKTLTML